MDVLASHIVGGELQMLHQRGESYLIRLVLYYDQANAEYNLIDQKIEVGIYRKSNNTRIDDTELEIRRTEVLDYANPNCIPDTLKTIKIVYEGVHRFSSERYSNSEGYYLSWERCCRNNIISNVYQPGRQGMVFLLEFPSIQEFPLNSSPTFNEVRGEYICLNRYTELDFGASDVNGDSLRYYLATPLAGYTSPDYPMSNLTGGPYPFVENYYLMPGNPFLQIDPQSGILSVRPSQRGLYVFRVVCEEYRNGKLIGAIHRDFQILVDECEDNFIPESRLFDQNGNIYREGDTLIIDSREELCQQIFITDRNSEDLINYEILPSGVSAKTPIFNPERGSIDSPGDTLKVEMCWPDCIAPDSGLVYEFYLLVKDNACPTQNIDSTRIILKFYEEDNSKPEIYVESSQIESAVGEQFQMWIRAEDADLTDSLSLGPGASDFTFSSSIWQNTFGNSVDGDFGFVAGCEDLKKEPYSHYLIVNDHSCASNNKDSVLLSVLINDYVPYERNIEIPANVITPNGDGLNEYFYFSRPSEGSCEFQNFESIVIYNRWGIEVFRSNDRDFKWYATDVHSGQYFYAIKFENSVYKGFIHVIK